MSLKATNSLRCLRVLVAEDDALISEFIADILVELECTVIGPARSLDEALRAIRANDFDAALLDVRLGEANIYPAANELKLRGIPFILTTGHGNLNESPALLRDAPRLTKPFNVRQLVDMLKSSFPA
jgi:DNA-binding response OmpR family regulator